MCHYCRSVVLCVLKPIFSTIAILAIDAGSCKTWEFGLHYKGNHPYLLIVSPTTHMQEKSPQDEWQWKKLKQKKKCCLVKKKVLKGMFSKEGITMTQKLKRSPVLSFPRYNFICSSERLPSVCLNGEANKWRHGRQFCLNHEDPCKESLYSCSPWFPAKKK